MIIPEERFMQAAIEEAMKARQQGDYAFGAVVVKDGEVIARGTNKVKVDLDATQHAEVVALRAAYKAVGARYLEGCVLYSTHEPCPMCTGAAVWSNMVGVVYGATISDISDYSQANSTHEWKWRVIGIPAREVAAKGDPPIEMVEGFMREECRKLFHA